MHNHRDSASAVALFVILFQGYISGEPPECYLDGRRGVLIPCLWAQCCDLNHEFAVWQGYGFRVSIIQPYMIREYADHRQVQRAS
jgi:hypothetical protein